MAMIERVARAMCEAWERIEASTKPPLSGSQVVFRPMAWERASEIWKALARAAFVAMREPDDRLRDAGGKSEPFIEPGSGPNGLWHPGEIVAATAWRAMIDAALNDPPTVL